ncbi:MAG: hypothetical protein ACYS8K_07905, partial [Planctomycetota bacterium]
MDGRLNGKGIAMRGWATLCVWAICCCLAVAAADDVKTEVARYVNVLRKDARDDAQLAGRLLEAARAQTDKPKLSAALYEEAYARGIRRPTGYPAAISAVEALIEKVPAEKARWQGMLVNVHRLRYARSPKAEQDKARTELANLLISFGKGHLRQRAYDEAVKFLQQASGLLRGRRSPLLAEVRQQLRHATAAKAAHAQLRALTARLAKDPASKAARAALIRLYVMELDRPKEAEKLLAADSDAACRTYVPLAAKDASTLPEGACLELAKWYENLSARAGASAFGKGQALKKAIEHYERYLWLHANRDMPCLTASSALAGARKKRAALGAPPCFLKAFVFPDRSSALRHSGTKLLNTGFAQRTLELWVRLGTGDGSIYEQGGDQRGMAVGVYQHELRF